MNTRYFKELCSALTKIRTSRDANAVLQDILTPKERAAVAQRLQIVKRLFSGMPHRKISNELKVSIAKVTRGSLAQRRSRGGFYLLLGKR